jgi:diguanylate cyclase (GGDEF)-like protein
MILIYQSAIILSFVSVILALLLLLFSLDFRIAEKSYFFIMLSIQIFLYTFGYFLELTSDNLFEALYAVRVQYIGLPFISTSSYLLLRDIYDRKSFSRPKKFFFYAIPFIVSGGMLSYPYTNFFYQNVEYHSNGTFANAIVTPGPLYFLHIFYSYSLVLVILLAIFNGLIGKNQLMKKQSIPLLIGFLVPVSASIIYILKPYQVQYDWTPVATLVLTIMLGYSANYQNLLNIGPFAKHQLVDSMPYAFIVFDKDLRFIDANPAAKEIFPRLNTVRSGELLPELNKYKGVKQVTITVNGEERVYEVALQTIKHVVIRSKYALLHDITEKERLLNELHNKAKYDYLTNIFNRQTFTEVGNQLINDARLDTMLIGGILDIDNFKLINDRFGHPCGDYVLKRFAQEIRSLMVYYPNSIFCRYGGEEFGFLFQELNVEEVLEFSEAFRKKIADLQIEWNEETINLTISMGLSNTAKRDTTNLNEIFLEADVALYQAKNAGKNQLVLYKNTQ